MHTLARYRLNLKVTAPSAGDRTARVITDRRTYTSTSPVCIPEHGIKRDMFLKNMLVSLVLIM